MTQQLEATVVDSGFGVNPDLLTDGGPGDLPAGVFAVGTEVPANRVELFRANGRIYTAPRVADPRITFRFMRALHRRVNQEQAISDMMYEILGEPVVDELADGDLTEDQLAQVMKVITKYTMSAFNRAGLGNS